MTTDTYTKEKRQVVAWVATTLAGVGILIAGWAHTKLWTHEVSIERQEERSKAVEQRFGGTEKRLDSIDSKLDRLLEAARSRP